MATGEYEGKLIDQQVETGEVGLGLEILKY